MCGLGEAFKLGAGSGSGGCLSSVCVLSEHRGEWIYGSAWSRETIEIKTVQLMMVETEARMEE